MNRRVLYRFRIERSQLTKHLRKYCDKVSGIWVEYEIEDVPHIPQRGDRVTGCGIELRVFDVQYYLVKGKHSALVECTMTELIGRSNLQGGESPMVPRKDLVTKQDLRYCATFGWVVKGIDAKHIS